MTLQSNVGQGLARRMKDDAYLLGKAWEGPEEDKNKEENSLSKGRATTTIDVMRPV